MHTDRELDFTARRRWTFGDELRLDPSGLREGRPRQNQQEEQQSPHASRLVRPVPRVEP
jgi:hypothetical protein